MAEAAATALSGSRVNRRLAFGRWVRRRHGWFGLWGALLGLMAGTSGIWLNHRSVMKLDLPDQQQAGTQLALPTLGRRRPRPWQSGSKKRSRSTARRSACGSSVRGRFRGRGGEGQAAMQPERWAFVFGRPNKVMQVEYWFGNRSASVRTTRNGFIATLINLHKGTTMPAPWILLIDTLAGAMIFLSISGAILGGRPIGGGLQGW